MKSYGEQRGIGVAGDRGDMNILDATAILQARNSKKKRCNVYYYEAMGNIARAKGFTASEFFFGCAAMAMKAMGCDMGYLTHRDKRIIESIRRSIEESKNHKVKCV